MAEKPKQSAFSLIELLVVIVIVASLTGLAIPAIRMMQQSYNSTGTENMISAALSNARSIAMSRQRYAGVRFQKAYNPDYPDDPLKQDQYMIFIMHHAGAMGNSIPTGYLAVPGYKPIKLPENIGVIDMTNIGTDGAINDPEELTNATAFSIIFSPSGKLVIRDLTIRNKDGVTSGTGSNDQVFNTLIKIKDPTNPTGMFVQDKDTVAGLEKELSRKNFVIYERKTFAGYFDNGDAYSQYLKNLKPVYINIYTGTIIEK